jgi:hypothetical protein
MPGVARRRRIAMDVKKVVREGENKVREVGRELDGHDVGDDIGNAGDDIRKDLGNAGDDIRKDLGNAGDDIRRNVGDTADRIHREGHDLDDGNDPER